MIFTLQKKKKIKTLTVYNVINTMHFAVLLFGICMKESNKTIPTGKQNNNKKHRMGDKENITFCFSKHRLFDTHVQQQFFLNGNAWC